MSITSKVHNHNYLPIKSPDILDLNSNKICSKDFNYALELNPENFEEKIFLITDKIK